MLLLLCTVSALLFFRHPFFLPFYLFFQRQTRFIFHERWQKGRGGLCYWDKCRLPLNKTVDQTFCEGLVTDWMRANRKGGGERRGKKCATTFQSDEKALWLFWGKKEGKKAVSSHCLILKRDCVCSRILAQFFNFHGWKEQQSFSPPSHLKMTTFHLYIVCLDWGFDFLFGSVTWCGSWQLPAEVKKPSTLSTFSWSLSHPWEAWCMLMTPRRLCGTGSCVTGTLQEQEGSIKNDATLKVCTSHPLRTLRVHRGAIWIKKKKRLRRKMGGKGKRLYKS